jgi:hypothetical protein
MAIQFVPGQVTISDPNPGGPSAISNVKSDLVKIVKLSGANFTTTNTDALVAVLPADATITSMSLWIKTQLAGNSVSAAALSVGSSLGGTQFLNAVSAFGAANTFAALTPISGIYQNYQVPLGSDIQIFARGTATTGNPTSGEMYLTIRYVR